MLAAMIALGATAARPAEADPVKVQGGIIEGTAEDGLSVYKGIPFAAPPIGPLRWRDPQPIQPWSGVRKADAFAPVCPQSDMMSRVLGLPVFPHSEDCLYLNVWSPAKSPSDRLPVMVWIYGGAFTGGSTAIPDYSGVNLAHRGVIVVSIAYRLGAFGFLADKALSAESGHGSGNYGLLDQMAGLRWVRQNIAAFGGDPNNVTIFGESAGAISVSMLAASPLAHGLFDKAISESGGSFAPLRWDDEGGTNVPPLSVAEKTGAAYLKSLGADDIAEARALPMKTILDGPPGVAQPPFWPVSDGYVIDGDAYGLYAAGRFNDTPVLIGTNGDEGALFVQKAPQAADYVAGIKTHYGAYADKILAAYPGDTQADALRSARDIFRDTTFAWPTWTWARLQDRTGKSPVYVYYFDRRPPYPDLPQLKDWGAVHSTEIPYVFGTLNPRAFGGLMTYTDADHALSDQMEAYWTNFAKTGDPNGAGLAAWPRFTNADPQTLHFDDTVDAGPVQHMDKLEVVDGYYAWLRAQDAAKVTAATP